MIQNVVSATYFLLCYVVVHKYNKCKNHSEYRCKDAPCEKLRKQGNPLSNTIKDTSTIMRNPLPELQGGITHDCDSILDSIAKGFCFHNFPHCASLHPCSVNYKCILVGIRSKMTITSSQTVTTTGENSISEVIITSSQTATMAGANSISEVIITPSQTATMAGANSISEVIITPSQTATMTGANSISEVSMTSSVIVTMTGANSSLNDLEVSFIAIAAVVAVLLVASMIVIGVVMYRHKRFRNAHNGPGPRYVFLWLAV